jgi:Prion-inhibition and propagation
MDTAGIALSLCSVCIQGYRSFQSLKSLGTDAQVILSKLEIQEYRLQGLTRTLENIKQAENTRDIRLVQYPIYNALESIKLLTTDATHLRKQYKLKLEIVPSIESDDERKEEREPGLAVVKIQRRFVVKWLLFDKTNMERLAADLKQLTDGLENLLAMAVRHEFPSSLVSAAIAALATSDPPALQRIVAASGGTYPDLAADAERKLERLAAEDGLRIESPRGVKVKMYGMEELSFSDSATEEKGKVEDEDGQRTQAMLVKTRQVVLVEWRALPVDIDLRERTLARLETVANILQISRPATMRTLDCPGYVVDRSCSRSPTWRAALVSCYPQDAAREPPKSLLRLLQASEDSRALDRPSLDDRYALALALAETVFSIHMSGWLHRCIGAHNVVFFRKEAGAAKGHLDNPYLTGFEFSREGGEDVATETVVERPGVSRYRHPGCQGPFRAGFKKEHDLYR